MGGLERFTRETKINSDAVCLTFGFGGKLQTKQRKIERTAKEKNKKRTAVTFIWYSLLWNTDVSQLRTQSFGSYSIQLMDFFLLLFFPIPSLFTPQCKAQVLFLVSCLCPPVVNYDSCICFPHNNIQYSRRINASIKSINAFRDRTGNLKPFQPWTEKINLFSHPH